MSAVIRSQRGLLTFVCSDCGAGFAMFHLHCFMLDRFWRKAIIKMVFNSAPWLSFLWLLRFANMQHSGHESMERSVLREVVTTHIYDLKTDEDESAWKPAKPDLVEAWKNHLGLPFLTHALLFQGPATAATWMTWLLSRSQSAWHKCCSTFDMVSLVSLW